MSKAKLAIIISADIYNNFTEHSIITYLQKTYNVKCINNCIYPDPEWFGRGAVLLTDEDYAKIPDDWESKLSEGYYEFDWFTDEEGNYYDD